MHAPIIARTFGLLLMLFSFTLIPPIAVALIYGEHIQQAFFLSFAASFSLGLISWLPFSNSRQALRTRDGFVITVLFWGALGLMGALPFFLVPSLHLSFTDAVFESMSGLTTTGATVMSGLDQLPRSILYYRQQLHWLGGIGVVVIAVAIMPLLGVGGMQLYRAETPGPVKDSKLTPRIAGTAKILSLIYVALTAACAAAYWLAGMSFFDALCHAFSTLSTGGFSTHDASIGYFHSTPIIFITIIFMVLAGMNFGLHFLVLRRFSPQAYWRDPESRFYLALLLAGAIITVAYLFYSHTFGLRDSLVHGVFTFVSIMTSTGYITTDFSIWPTFLPVFLIIAAFFGGCGGSTGGGVKIGRMLILAKQGVREMRRLVHPSAVILLKTGKRVVPDAVIKSVWAFFGVYIAVYYFMVLLLMGAGVDFLTAWTAVAACINNMGPGLGNVAVHFRDLGDFATWVLTVTMLLGRLEIFPLLVVVTPMFWRR